MNYANEDLRKSAVVMKAIGWLLIIGLPVGMLIYPPGFLWGVADLPRIGPAHPDSPLDGLHPYVFMIGVLYLAWAILMIRGARDPNASASLFDWGILANLLHALLMVPMALIYPNEMAHLWTDVPLLLAMCLILWMYHPARAVRIKARG